MSFSAKENFAPDRPRRQIAAKNYRIRDIESNFSEASSVIPVAKAGPEKRKADTSADVGPKKSARGAAKKATTVAKVPQIRAAKRKAPAKSLSKAKTPRNISATSLLSAVMEAAPPKNDKVDNSDTDTPISEFDTDDDADVIEDLEVAYNKQRISTIQLSRRQAPSQKFGATVQKRKSGYRPTAASAAKGKAKPLATLNVVLKVPASWLTGEGEFTPPFAKTSSTPKKTPISERRMSSIPKTPRAPAKEPASAIALPTPPAENQDVNQSLLDLEALIDHEQLRLSHKLVHRSPIVSKPIPQGSPEVWADSRQALCETVPYFKMPQSGCHQNDGHVYSFLYDGAIRCREYMDSDLIISGAGGGMEVDSKTGQLVQKKHHTMDEAQVKAVMNDIEHKNPLVIICGNKSEGAICKMPHRYNVLDWFKPVAVWAEKTMGKKGRTWTTIRYRFERLNQAKPAWNAPSDSESTLEYCLSEDDRQSIPPLVSKECTTCSKVHPEVYLTGWMCLSAGCDQFWKLSNGKDAPYGENHFHPAFLLARTEWAVETEPFSVKPPVLRVGSTVGDNLTQINTRGMCCPKCGRCNSRRLFKGWRCESAACAFENFPKHIPVQIPLLHQPWESTGEGPSLARNKHDRAQGVEMSVDFKHGFKVYRYTVPGVKGALLHLVSNTNINKMPGGANDMFDAMQREDVHLERRRFGIEKMSGGKTQAKSQTEPVQTLPVELDAPLPQNAQEDLSKVVENAAAALEFDGETELEPRAELAVKDLTAEVQQNTTELSSPVASTKVDRAPVPPNDPTRDADAGTEPEAKKKDVIEDGDFMTAFSMNYGMPYKFIATCSSLPFQDSPWPVRAARADINWASQEFLDVDGHEDMNEELIFAYMEGQKLEYHDDGEEGLGSRIGTLSLGGKAKMNLRMKMKHYTGCSKTGLFTKERPVPGSIAGKVDGVQLSSYQMYERRLAAWEELQQLLTTDRKAYNKRAKEIPLELGLFDKRMKKADDLVTVTLNHGDIILMEGFEYQSYLEHKVVPEQCLRFALTCRTILPDHLKPEERPSYGEEPDEEAMSALRRMANAGDKLKEN